MITFGGRPLNTYKKTYKGGSGYLHYHEDMMREVERGRERDREEERRQAMESELNLPIPTLIQTAISMPLPPQPATPPQPQTLLDHINDENVATNVMKKLKRAELKSGFFAKIFGLDVIIFLIFLGGLVSSLFKIFIIFIIISIVGFIYRSVQMSLDISHKVVGGLAKTMQDTVDQAVVGGNKIGPFRIPKLKILGFLQKPTNDVKKVDTKIPRKAYEVIIFILRDTFKGILNALPNIFEGSLNMIISIFD